jgi:hypothetical protein
MLSDIATMIARSGQPPTRFGQGHVRWCHVLDAHRYIGDDLEEANDDVLKCEVGICLLMVCVNAPARAAVAHLDAI